ncbi:major facilitator superfamily domain-containing protein [Astrocystis sublimbata]|nr:major facilitator superfamily domain-containing protein [Astrocystis sublimbata]
MTVNTSDPPNAQVAEGSEPQSPPFRKMEEDTSNVEKAGGMAAAESDRSARPESEKGETARTIRGFKWFIVYTTLLSTVLFYALESTVVANIQPSIVETFGSVDKLPWIGTAVYLGGQTILPTGRAYAVFNVKWYFLTAVVIFQAGSILCGAAPNIDALIVGRVLQGAGASGCYSGAITYLSMITSPQERPLYLSGVIGVWAAGSVVGPVIGGAFAETYLTWRWGFYINPVVAGAVAPGLIFYLPNIDPAPELTFRQKLRSMDWIGIFAFLGGAALFITALTFGGIEYPFNSATEIVLFTLSGIFLVAFILVSVYHPFVPLKNRLYPIHLHKRLELSILQYCIVVDGGALVTTLFYMPLLFQFTRGDGPLEAGVRLLPFLSTMVAFCVLNGILLPRWGYYMPWYAFGTALLLVGSALMATVTASTSDARLYGYNVLLGSGCGAFFTAGFSITQSLVSESELSNVISFMSVGQTMGSIFYLSLGGSLFQNIGSQQIRRLIPTLSTGDALQLTTGTNSDVYKALSPHDQTIVVEQVTIAIGHVFLVIVITSAIAFIGSLFLSRRKIY